MNERNLIFQSLIDTFIKYLQPIVFVDSFSKQHIYSEIDKFEELLVKIGENDKDILEFAHILSQASQNSEIKKLIQPDANKDALFESFYLKYVPLLIDGTLIKDLTLDDYLHIAKELKERKLILNKNYDICKHQTNKDDCQREIFKSIKRGKPHWPFVFIETVKQKRSDIFKIQLDNFQTTSMDIVFHNESNHPDSSSFVSESNNSSTYNENDESSESILSSECNFFDELLSDQEEESANCTQGWHDISNLQFIIKNGAMNINEIPSENFATSEINYLGRSKFSDEEDSTESELDDDCTSVESESSDKGE